MSDKLYLTPRQREIIQLVARGMETKQIANELSVSYYTIQNHRVAILEALSAKNMCEAVAIACHSGLIRKCTRCGAFRTDNIDSDICGSCADALRVEQEAQSETN